MLYFRMLLDLLNADLSSVFWPQFGVQISVFCGLMSGRKNTDLSEETRVSILFHPNGYKRFHRNFGKVLPNHTASHPSSLCFSTLELALRAQGFSSPWLYQCNAVCRKLQTVKPITVKFCAASPILPRSSFAVNTHTQFISVCLTKRMLLDQHVPHREHSISQL